MKIIQSKLLNNFSNITHGFTCRDGGVSEKPYESLNLALHVEDELSDVSQNHQLLADDLIYNKRTLVHMKQIHSNRVHRVTSRENFENPPTCDALITNIKNTPLMVMVADCSPILFYDPKKEVIAVAHAGRAGAFKNIVKNVIDSFVTHFDSNIEDILVSIGASIGACCYEVGEEIYKEAKELHVEHAIQKKGNKYHLDIPAILLKQLLTCRVKKEHIEFSNECTCCLNNKYFSYRADNITGRFAGVIKLN